jgi:osmotically-inducible protein OsmY
MKQLGLTIVLIVSTLVTVACNDSGGIGLSLSKAYRQVKLSNSDLEDAVLAKLRSDAQLVEETRLAVRADVNKNLVTLSGIVASDEARTKAIGLAKSARAGLTVDNQIEVRPVVG